MGTNYRGTVQRFSHQFGVLGMGLSAWGWQAESSEQWCTSAQRRPRSVAVFLGRRRIIGVIQ